MRIIIQRVLDASVTVAGKEISRIGKGLLVLLGITHNDDFKLAEKMAKKLLKIRVWDEVSKKEKPSNSDIIKSTNAEEEELKKPELSEKILEKEEKEQKEPKSWHSCVIDNEFEILVVSQFTLYGILKGNKPDFHKAMGSDEARKMYEYFLQILKKEYQENKIKGGAFQEYMHVNLTNDGPVTLVYEEENEDNIQINEKNNKKKK